MTFDEMIKELKDMGDEYFIEPLMLLPEVEKLRETYAKPVEMTREDYDNAQECRDRYNFDDDNTRGSSRFSWYFETEEEAMRAWLHPELIKVVE